MSYYLHIVLGGQTSNGPWHLSSVMLHSRPAGGFGQSMKSFCRQSNDSSMATLHSGPVVLCPVRATPCFLSNEIKDKNVFMTLTDKTSKIVAIRDKLQEFAVMAQIQ